MQISGIAGCRTWQKQWQSVRSDITIPPVLPLMLGGPLLRLSKGLMMTAGTTYRTVERPQEAMEAFYRTKAQLAATYPRVELLSHHPPRPLNPGWAHHKPRL